MELSNYKFPTCKGCICKDCIHNEGICSGCENCIGTQSTECQIYLPENDGQ